MLAVRIRPSAKRAPATLFVESNVLEVCRSFGYFHGRELHLFAVVVAPGRVNFHRVNVLTGFHDPSRMPITRSQIVPVEPAAHPAPPLARPSGAVPLAGHHELVSRDDVALDAEV